MNCADLERLYNRKTPDECRYELNFILSTCIDDIIECVLYECRGIRNNSHKGAKINASRLRGLAQQVMKAIDEACYSEDHEEYFHDTMQHVLGQLSMLIDRRIVYGDKGVEHRKELENSILSALDILLKQRNALFSVINKTKE